MARPLVIAHRGASSVAPENTLVAFRSAMEQGADGVEMDIHLSRDGVPMVIHDPLLLRTTGTRGRVAEKSARELKELDAGRYFNPKFAGERIPTLEEVAREVPGRLFVEVKDSPRSVPAVLRTLKEAGALGRATVISFHPLILRQAAKLPTGLLLADESPNFLKRPLGWRLSKARAIAPFYTLANGMMETAKRRGLPVYPWTVDSLGIGRSLMERGASGLITNRPGRMVKLRDEMGL
ncbi:MAG: glycerophosphodiester phosphodiesterase family protein [Halobacteria archaeon]